MMDAALMEKIASGEPGVMLVVSAADLRDAVAWMWRACQRETEEAVRSHRERPTMTREEAAKALNVTLSTLWRWAKDGYLVPVKIGSKVLYRATDIEEVLTMRGDGGSEMPTPMVSRVRGGG